MQYCYHCSEPLLKPAKVCPHCKGTLDLSMYEDLLEEHESSHINTGSVRRIWFLEHSHLIWPAVTLFIGFILGGIMLYFFAQQSFAGERSELQNEIAGLETQLRQKENAASDATENLNDQIGARDNIITILDEQKTLLIRIINFTRSFAQSSIITPGSDDVADRFKRNFIYLNNQYNSQQDLLQETDHGNIQNNNLQTIPQILSD